MFGRHFIPRSVDGRWQSPGSGFAGTLQDVGRTWSIKCTISDPWPLTSPWAICPITWLGFFIRPSSPSSTAWCSCAETGGLRPPPASGTPGPPALTFTSVAVCPPGAVLGNRDLSALNLRDFCASQESETQQTPPACPPRPLQRAELSDGTEQTAPSKTGLELDVGRLPGKSVRAGCVAVWGPGGTGQCSFTRW